MSCALRDSLVEYDERVPYDGVSRFAFRLSPFPVAGLPRRVRQASPLRWRSAFRLSLFSFPGCGTPSVEYDERVPRWRFAFHLSPFAFLLSPFSFLLSPFPVADSLGEYAERVPYDGVSPFAFHLSPLALLPLPTIAFQRSTSRCGTPSPNVLCVAGLPRRATRSESPTMAFRLSRFTFHLSPFTFLLSLSPSALRPPPSSRNQPLPPVLPPGPELHSGRSCARQARFAECQDSALPFPVFIGKQRRHLPSSMAVTGAVPRSPTP